MNRNRSFNDMPPTNVNYSIKALAVLERDIVGVVRWHPVGQLPRWQTYGRPVNGGKVSGAQTLRDAVRFTGRALAMAAFVDNDQSLAFRFCIEDEAGAVSVVAHYSPGAICAPVCTRIGVIVDVEEGQ